MTDLGPFAFNTRSSATAYVPRDALSVKILSTAETKCTTNPQIKVIELEGYRWSTCSKQPWFIDWSIGVVNKLDRRRRLRRVLLTTRSTWRGEIEISKSVVWDKVQEGITLIFGDTQISLQHSVGYVEESLHAKNQLDSSSPFHATPAYDGQTDGQTDRQTRDDSIYRAVKIDD